MEKYQGLGERVKELRKSRGWSLYDLAARIHVTPSGISRLESRGISHRPTIESIARVFCVRCEWLLTGEGDRAEEGVDPELKSQFEEANSKPPERRAEIKRVLAAMLALSVAFVVYFHTCNLANAACAKIAAAFLFISIIALIWRCHQMMTKLNNFAYIGILE